jgi:hypothetical protein
LAEPPLEPITAEDHLYRRLVPNGHVAADGKTVLWSAFLRKRPGEKKSEPDPELSVDLARLTTPEATARGAERPGFGTAQFAASAPLAMGLVVRHVPLPPDRYAHSQVEGMTNREQCQRLADASTLIVPPNPAPRTGF